MPLQLQSQAGQIGYGNASKLTVQLLNSRFQGFQILVQPFESVLQARSQTLPQFLNSFFPFFQGIQLGAQIGKGRRFILAHIF